MKAYDEANRIRQLNEMRIQQNGQMMDTLRKSLMQSDEQTKKMTMLLDNFENRLTTMHGHIMPVYEATNILQIKYSSKLKIRKTNYNLLTKVIKLVYFLSQTCRKQALNSRRSSSTTTR